MRDFAECYTILETPDGQHIQNVLADAIALAKANGVDDGHIWFVRHQDDEPEDGGECIWYVEFYTNQFVNCLGFFVTKEKCQPADMDKVFQY